MGIIKNWVEDNEGYCFRYRILHLISPLYWLRLHKYRMQRADRGWSDRDTWATGEYIAAITAEMLQYLNDESYGNWPEWFRRNTSNTGVTAYKDLQHVIDDITTYLDYEKTSWTDEYESVPKDPDRVLSEKDSKNILNSSGWMNKITGEVISEEKLSKVMDAHFKKGDKLYKKATNAMKFFGNNFTSFWD